MPDQDPRPAAPDARTNTEWDALGDSAPAPDENTGDTPTSSDEAPADPATPAGEGTDSGEPDADASGDTDAEPDSDTDAESDTSDESEDNDDLESDVDDEDDSYTDPDDDEDTETASDTDDDAESDPDDDDDDPEADDEDEHANRLIGFANGEAVVFMDRPGEEVNLQAMTQRSEELAMHVIVETTEGKFLIRPNLMFDITGSTEADRLLGAELDENSEELPKAVIGQDYVVPGYGDIGEVQSLQVLTPPALAKELSEDEYNRHSDNDGPFSFATERLSIAAGFKEADDLRVFLAPDPNAPEMNPPATSHFEQVAAEKHPLSDQTVIDIINGNMTVAGVQLDMPTYFRNYASDASDNEFIHDDEKLSDFHAGLADFINRRLDVIAQDLRPDEMDDLAVRVQRFKDGLEDNAANVDQYFSDLKANGGYLGFSKNGVGGSSYYKDNVRHDMEFYGLNVTDDDGRQVDLLEVTGTDRFISNMAIERNRPDLSLAYLNKPMMANLLREGSEDEVMSQIDRGIVLNPTQGMTLEIFNELVDRAEAAGVPALFGVYDRSMAAMTNVGAARQAHVPVETDGIMLGAIGVDADKLLEVVKSVYADYPEAFAGRKTSQLHAPLTGYDGVALYEPSERKRVDLIGAAAADTRKYYGVTPRAELNPDYQTEAIRTFRRYMDAMSGDYGLNAKNLGFKRRPAAAS